MIMETMNFVISLLVFVSVVIMEASFFGEWNIEFLSRASHRVFRNRLWAIVVYESVWIYLMVSVYMFFASTDPAVIGMILPIGVGGAIALPIEVNMRNVRGGRHVSGPDIYLRRVEYDYRNRSRSTTIETVRALVEESHNIEDAQAALQTLFKREDGLGELAREVVSSYP